LSPLVRLELPLATERLVLRPFTLDDFRAFASFDAEPEVIRFLARQRRTRGETIIALRHVIHTTTTCGHGTYAIILAGAVIGWVGLKPLPLLDDRFEILYGLGRNHWGKGYAREAAAALMEAGFRAGLSQIVAVVHPDNLRSIRVLEALGMTFEGEIDYPGVEGKVRWYEKAAQAGRRP
jgi:ribosomal-protein-alanine N-acetyltransferase